MRYLETLHAILTNGSDDINDDLGALRQSSDLTQLAI